MVDAIYTQEKLLHYWQDQVQLLAKDTQIRHQTKEIDDKNGNTLWMESIRREMRENRVALKNYEGNVEDFIGYEELTGHLKFHVKLGQTFRRKLIFVTNRNLVETPSCITYCTILPGTSFEFY